MTSFQLIEKYTIGKKIKNMKQEKIKEHFVSFLMAAHNEDKVIDKTLTNLLEIPYNNFEVIVGLDGCDDRTEEIVKGLAKKYGNLRYYILNIREGKPAVINEIIKKSLRFL